MRPWIACAVLVAVCARVAWVARSSREAVNLATLVAGAAVVLTLLH